MKAFRLKGSFHMHPGEQPFQMEVAADDEDSAREYVYSILGSRHRARRSQIHIYRITELAPADVTDPTVVDVLEDAGVSTAMEEE